jgi:hypothetical protein
MASIKRKIEYKDLVPSSLKKYRTEKNHIWYCMDEFFNPHCESADDDLETGDVKDLFYNSREKCEEKCKPLTFPKNIQELISMHIDPDDIKEAMKSKPEGIVKTIPTLAEEYRWNDQMEKFIKSKNYEGVINLFSHNRGINMLFSSIIYNIPHEELIDNIIDPIFNDPILFSKLRKKQKMIILEILFYLSDRGLDMVDLISEYDLKFIIKFITKSASLGGISPKTILIINNKWEELGEPSKSFIESVGNIIINNINRLLDVETAYKYLTKIMPIKYWKLLSLEKFEKLTSMEKGFKFLLNIQNGIFDSDELKNNSNYIDLMNMYPSTWKMLFIYPLTKDLYNFWKILILSSNFESKCASHLPCDRILKIIEKMIEEGYPLESLYKTIEMNSSK